jgi:isopentenyldiphosphate isomerase
MPDELLDVVSDDDIVTGKEFRSIIHQYGLQHRGVHVFLVTPDSRLLVQRRGKHKGVFPLALDCSVSEHAKAGEEYHQAAARGLQEELGISQVQIQELVKFKMEYGTNDFEICILYEGKIDPSLISFDPLEVEGIVYYTRAELEALIESDAGGFSAWFVQLLRWYVEKPSELDVIETFTNERLLLLTKNQNC